MEAVERRRTEVFPLWIGVMLTQLQLEKNINKINNKVPQQD